MNTVVPQAWIIQEKKRREEERRRREESDSVPISLPKDLEMDDEYFEQQGPHSDAPPKTTVVVIDL